MTFETGGSLELGELVNYLDHYLDRERITDYGPNGLQVAGSRPVRTLAVGVSSCRELFEQSEQAQADGILVHHGLFWKNTPQALTGVQYDRVSRLIHSGTALIAYHLPLDRHPEIGNNALALRGLGIDSDLQPFAAHRGTPIGFWGRFERPIGAQELAARCEQLFGQPPLIFPARREIQSLGVVTGGGAEYLNEAIDLGLDAFLTGEPSEWVKNVAEEAGTTFVAAGHYATERLGVQALAEHLSERFGIRTTFIDVPNPV